MFESAGDCEGRQSKRGLGVAVAAVGPSRFAKAGGIRGQHLCHVPDGDLGPAGPLGAEAALKDQSQNLESCLPQTLLERQEKVRTEERLASMASKKV